LHDLLEDLAPADAFDPVIEVFKVGLGPITTAAEPRIDAGGASAEVLSFARLAHELRDAGRRAREQDPSWGLK
jgi:hypothetical protein